MDFFAVLNNFFAVYMFFFEPDFHGTVYRLRSEKQGIQHLLGTQ